MVYLAIFLLLASGTAFFLKSCKISDYKSEHVIVLITFRLCQYVRNVLSVPSTGVTLLTFYNCFRNFF